ncbi:somatoliberin [Moschus berezovskii]|uniref:somatoliberin n=1 Tax=Moschus berezovskii TaxID=68408 RepID=UPI002443C2D4|nr:somatoliberin [Moschus berezovskii]
MLLWVFFLVTLTLSSGSHGSLPSQPLRIPRYADAIFTNSYRKVLGQLSARKLLQDIMNRQQGARNQEQGAKVRLGRQAGSVWPAQQQVALESILGRLLQERSLPSKKECEAWERLRREPGWLRRADNTHNGEQKTPPEEKAGL